jgi:hypothetical protein
MVLLVGLVLARCLEKKVRYGSSSGLFYFIVHHKVKSTGFQPVSFSIENEGAGGLKWTIDMEATRYFRLSITLYG